MGPPSAASPRLEVVDVKRSSMAVLGVVGLLAMAGCGSVSTGISTNPSLSGPSSASSSTPTPTPTADVKAVAAQAYLSAANAYNQVDDQASASMKALPSDAAWATTVPMAQQILAADQTFENAVFKIAFPAQDQADVSALVKGLATDITDLQAIISDPSDVSWSTYENDGTSGDANAVRNDLGLPPVPSS
jgi:hypothetical protein